MSNIARPGIEGELIDLPPEPPHDHVVVTGWGDVYMWIEPNNSWVEMDSQYGMNETWKHIAQNNRELTIYKPVKVYERP